MPVVLICIWIAVGHLQPRKSDNSQEMDVVKQFGPSTNIEIAHLSSIQKDLNHTIAYKLVTELPATPALMPRTDGSLRHGPVYGPFGYAVDENHAVYIGDVAADGGISVLRTNWQGKLTEKYRVTKHRYGGVSGAMGVFQNKLSAALPAMPRILTWTIGATQQPKSTESIEYPGGSVPHSVDALWSTPDGLYALIGIGSGGYHADNQVFGWFSPSGGFHAMDLSNLVSLPGLLGRVVVTTDGMTLIADVVRPRLDNFWSITSFYAPHRSLVRCIVPAPPGFVILSASPIGQDIKGNSYSVVELVNVTPSHMSEISRTLWRTDYSSARLLGTLAPFNTAGLRDQSLCVEPDGNIYCVGPMPAWGVPSSLVHFGLYQLAL